MPTQICSYCWRAERAASTSPRDRWIRSRTAYPGSKKASDATDSVCWQSEIASPARSIAASNWFHSRRMSACKMARSEEHTSELQSPDHLVSRLLLDKKKPPLDSSPQAPSPLE